MAGGALALVTAKQPMVVDGLDQVGGFVDGVIDASGRTRQLIGLASNDADDLPCFFGQSLDL